MPKFIVTLQVITWHDYQVEAESLAEAEAIARERRGQEGWQQEGSRRILPRCMKCGR